MKKIKYYLNLNAQYNGEHEIHKETCYYYTMYNSGYNFELLGSFLSEYDAMRTAKEKHPTMKLDGCVFCFKNIHRG